MSDAWPPPNAGEPRRGPGGGQQGADGTLTRLVRTRPKVMVFAALAAGVLVGIGIGAAAVDRQAEIDAAEQRARDMEVERGTALADLAISKESERKLRERVGELTSGGKVPSLVGSDVDDVEDDELVQTYRWKVRRVDQVSRRLPGTVISQRPKAGGQLKAGETITVVAAKAAPPKPKRWVTVKTFTGGGSTKTAEFTLDGQAKARLRYSMPSDGNNAIQLYDADSGEYVDLLLNEIGPQSGVTRLYQDGTFYLDVTGQYTIEIQKFKRPG